MFKYLLDKFKTIYKIYNNKNIVKEEKIDQDFWQIIDEVEENKHITRVKYRFYEKEFTEYTSNYNSIDKTELAFYQLRFTSYIYKICNCVVDSKSSLPIINDKYIFSRSHQLMSDPWGLFRKRPSVKMYFDKKRIEKHIDSAILINYDWYNYYHFLIDTIPQIEMADNAGLSSEIPILVPMGYDSKDFVNEYFREIKPLKRPIITLDKNIFYSVNNLYIIKDVFFSDNILVGKNNFKIMNNNENPEKIYVARHVSQGRAILNFIEIEGFLRKNGFEIIEPGDYTITEQIKLFSNAKFIIGLHGAGMTNMIFTRQKHIKVVEIFKGGNEFADHYKNLSSYLSFTYDRIVGSVPDTNNNFTLDVSMLNKYM